MQCEKVQNSFAAMAPKLDQARLGPSGTMDRLDKPNHVMCNK